MALMSVTVAALSASGEDLGSALLVITLVLSAALAMPLILARLEPDARGRTPPREAGEQRDEVSGTPDRPIGPVDRAGRSPS
jgi:hypothetical protein